MKRLIILFTLCLGIAAAQNTHRVSLAWQDLINPPGTDYTIYRAPGSCTLSSSFTPIASAIAQKTYEDQGVLPGKWCYAVTANYGGEESDKSDPAQAQVKPFKPGGLTTAVSTVASVVTKPFRALARATRSGKRGSFNLRARVS